MSRAYDWGTELPNLSGKRIALRPLNSEDVPAIFELFRNAEVCRYWSSPPYSDSSQAAALVQETLDLFAARALFQWGFCELGTDQVIGTCTLYQIDQANHRGELGFALNREYWGRGFGTDAVEVLLEFAFEHLNLHRIEADVDPRNAGSLRLLERQGFQREGLLRQRWEVAGEIQDAVFLGLLRDEWTRSESS